MISNQVCAERIVECFQKRVTEAHWQALMEYAGVIGPRHRGADNATVTLAYERFRTVVPTVRDLGVDNGMRVTPIYDHDGWWTCEPTRRLALIAIREAFRRNLGEAERNARVYRGWGAVGRVAAMGAAQTDGNLLAWSGGVYEEFGDYSLPGANVDYIVERVGDARERESLWVAR